VALTATIYNFDFDLADTDRGVYETLALRVARHPSESEEYMLTRVLAYALEYAEGIEFSTGLSTPNEPAIVIRDLTGAVVAWIEVGTPDADRLNRAAKGASRVAVYMHKDSAQYLARLAGERVYRAEQIELWAMDRSLLAAMVARLERRMNFAVSVSDRELLVSIGRDTLSGTVKRMSLAASDRT
jgi:uncharacterized protein YaeQ